MSQAGSVSGGGSGPLPPTVPTSFLVQENTDFDYVAGTETATAAANVIQLLGDNGIKTDVNLTDDNVILIRFIRGEAQTVGATTQTCITQAVSTNTTLTIQIIVAGLADNNEAIGGYATATVKNVAGVASLVGTVDIIITSDATLIAGNITVTTVGANLLVNVTGVAGRTINWTTALPGIVST